MKERGGGGRGEGVVGLMHRIRIRRNKVFQNHLGGGRERETDRPTEMIIGYMQRIRI